MWCKLSHVGLADRDYNRWTPMERRRFYQGHSGIPWLTIALVLAFAGYVAYGAIATGTHNGKHYRWCTAIVHVCTGAH
jgi:hypothetical protein